MDNKTKCLYVAIAVLLVSNGYLLYRLGNAEGKTNESDSLESSLVGHYRHELTLTSQSVTDVGLGPVETNTLRTSLNLRSDNIAENMVGRTDNWSAAILRVGEWSLTNKEVVVVYPPSKLTDVSTKYYRINYNGDLIQIARKAVGKDRTHLAEKNFSTYKKIK